jgi:hypothetical protein
LLHLKGIDSVILESRNREYVIDRVRAGVLERWMTQTLHRFPDQNPFDYKRQLPDLDYLTCSKAALTSLAENYVGLPLEVSF